MIYFKSCVTVFMQNLIRLISTILAKKSGHIVHEWSSTQPEHQVVSVCPSLFFLTISKGLNLLPELAFLFLQNATPHFESK